LEERKKERGLWVEEGRRRRGERGSRGELLSVGRGLSFSMFSS